MLQLRDDLADGHHRPSARSDPRRGRCRVGHARPRRGSRAARRCGGVRGGQRAGTSADRPTPSARHRAARQHLGVHGRRRDLAGWPPRERAAPGHGADSLLWERVEGDARENSSLSVTFLVLMAVAAVIATVGIGGGLGRPRHRSHDRRSRLRPALWVSRSASTVDDPLRDVVGRRSPWAFSRQSSRRQGWQRSPCSSGTRNETSTPRVASSPVSSASPTGGPSSSRSLPAWQG